MKSATLIICATCFPSTAFSYTCLPQALLLLTATGVLQWKWPQPVIRSFRIGHTYGCVYMDIEIHLFQVLSLG